MSEIARYDPRLPAGLPLCISPCGRTGAGIVLIANVLVEVDVDELTDGVIWYLDGSEP